MLQIELIGYTHVRAHDLTRSESSSWVIMSQSNMNIPLGDPSDPIGKEWKVPSRYWENIPLPNTVAPSFDTCNISRTYELEVRVGLAHGGSSKSKSIKPELIVLPLRLPVKIYSGVAPPAALLQRMASSHPKVPGAGGQFAATLQPPSPSSFFPSTPITPSYAHNHPPAPPGTISNITTPSSFQPSSRPPDDNDDDAPPSYEDAIADEIAPVDGPRRDYSVPSTPGMGDRRDSGFGVDSKSSRGGVGGGGTGGLGRRVSERLFPQNAAGMGDGGLSGRHSRQSSSSEDDGGGGVAAAAAAAAGVVAAGAGDRADTAQPPSSRLARKPTLPPSFEESTTGGG